jgi:hypothetical protein
LSGATPSGGAGRLPIVIGVTGHRDLSKADEPIYRARVLELFAELRQRYPATPLRVLSPLAAGADRLVAELAIDSGCELIVPLPLEPYEYERDFPDSIAEFRAILARVPPEHVFVMPFNPGSDRQSVRDNAEHRDQQYHEVGAYIAAQSHILLALWDGVPNASTGGTASVVRIKLEGGDSWSRASLRALSADDGGPVFHVHAPRAASSATELRESAWLFPQDGDAQLFDAVGLRIDRFNSDAARERITDEIRAAARSLLPEVESRPPSDQELATAFAYADRLASHYQHITHGVLRITLGLAACLALTFETYAEVLPYRALPIAYLVMFASITLFFLWQQRVDAQGRYLDYRALAEGLRVQFYWRLSGLRDNVSANYLRKQLDELRWIREALRGASTVPPITGPRPDLVLKHWVHGQADYYHARTELQRRRIHRVERWSRIFLGAGLIATAVLVVFWEEFERLVSWHHWLVLIMGFAPIGAALWEAYGEKFGLRTQANQYARFATIFRRAERFIARLEAEGLSAERQHAELDLIRELGCEALMENGDWVLVFRDRPIVLPKG